MQIIGNILHKRRVCFFCEEYFVGTGQNLDPTKRNKHFAHRILYVCGAVGLSLCGHAQGDRFRTFSGENCPRSLTCKRIIEQIDSPRDAPSGGLMPLLARQLYHRHIVAGLRSDSCFAEDAIALKALLSEHMHTRVHTNYFIPSLTEEDRAEITLLSKKHNWVSAKFTERLPSDNDTLKLQYWIIWVSFKK